MKRGNIMTHFNSTAKKLPSYDSERSGITLVNYAHRRNMLKQKLYGLAATIAPTAARPCSSVPARAEISPTASMRNVYPLFPRISAAIRKRP